MVDGAMYTGTVAVGREGTEEGLYQRRLVRAGLAQLLHSTFSTDKNKNKTRKFAKQLMGMFATFHLCKYQDICVSNNLLV